VLPASIAPSVPRKADPTVETRHRIYRQCSQIAEFRTPGLKSDVGSGNFVAEGKRKQAWKLSGHVLVTT
jgi:hypothetical protein